MRVPSPLIGRVRPQAQDYGKPISVGGINAEAFGGAIGAGLAGLGKAIANAGEVYMDRDTQMEKFDALKKQSQFELELAQGREEIARTAQPDGSDVPDRMKTLVEDRKNQFLNSVNPGLRPEMEVRAKAAQDRETLAANNFRTKAQDATVQQGILDELSRAKTVTNQDPDQADAAIGRLREMVINSPLSTFEKERQLRMIDVEVRKVEYQRRTALGQYNTVNADPAGAVGYVTERIVQVESGGDTAATNSRSSATGLGQFTEGTWLGLIRNYKPELVEGRTAAQLLELRKDPALAREMTGLLLNENAKLLRGAGVAPTPTNLYLTHFLGGAGGLRAVNAPDDARIETFVGAEAIEANPGVFNKVKTAGELRAWAQEKMGTRGGGPSALPPIEVKQDKNGYWVTDGIEYDLQGKMRPLPVSREYVERVVPTIKAIDPTLSIRVTSGGQHPGEGRGHRHNADSKGEAGTSDFVLMRNGKPIRPTEDKALYVRVAEELAARGFTGIGHYDWGLHVGGGSKAAWGPSMTSKDLDPDFKRAIERGWARASDRGGDALDTDLRYRNIPFEDRVLLRRSAEKESQNMLAAEAQQRQVAQQQLINNLQHAIMDGKAGQAEIDKAYQSGLLNDFRVRKQIQDLYDRTDSEGKLATKADAKLATPGAIWDPTSKEDKEMLNIKVKQNKGLDRIAAGDQEYFSNSVVPLVRQTSDIPTELVGTLTGMVRSNNLSTSLYALDALSQLQRIDPRAYEQRIPDAVQRDVDYFTSRRGTKPDAELMNEINGGNTPEQMQITQMLRKQAKDVLTDKVNGKVVEDQLQKAVIAPFDGWFSSKPDTASLRWAAEGMMKEARTIFIDEYVREKDINKAVEATAKIVQRTWGVSDVNDKKVMMKHPPEKSGYRPIGGDYNWMKTSVREELKLKPDDKFELLSDAQTTAEYERFRLDPKANPPSYTVLTTDKNGQVRMRMKTLPDGREVPYRMYMQPDPKLVPFLIDKEARMQEIETTRQQIRELQGFLMFNKSTDNYFDNLDTSTPAAEKELRKQLEIEQEKLNLLMSKNQAKDPRRTVEDEFMERMRALGNQSTIPSMRN